MKATNRRQQGRNGFDLIEEATHLLRSAPVGTWFVYYLGSMPLVLAGLYFWADMSRSPLATQHLGGASLGLTLAFFWMKFWQADFACRLRAQVAREPLVSPGWRGSQRIFCNQLIVQATGLFLLPLATVPLLPFAWVYAFYQNVTVLDAGDRAGLGALLKQARQQAKLWPRQNHLVLGVLSAFAICVLINWYTVGMAIPELLKMCLGVETVFTRSSSALANSTYLAALFGLTYLCVDPLVKTVYVLRCFYGESLQSGADLKSELKPFAIPAARAAALLLIGLACLLPVAARAETNAPVGGVATPVIAPPDLDHAINQTIHERKYLWRMPREQVVEPDKEEGMLAKFWDQVEAALRQWAKSFSEWLDKWMQKHSHDSSSHVQPAGSGYGWIMSLQMLLYGLLAVVVVAVVILLIRLWRGRPPARAVVASEAIQPVPDITDENVHAGQLPEDGWMQLARELLERGEFRLAMRAFYLSSLAQLAARNLISLARFKSNRDYERELRRRAHAFPGLLPVFGDNLQRFEGIWYGLHEVNRDLVNEFAANVERMKSGG